MGGRFLLGQSRSKQLVAMSNTDLPSSDFGTRPSPPSVPSVCRMNLRAIGQAAAIHEGNYGAFPPDLLALVNEGPVTPSQRRCPGRPGDCDGDGDTDQADLGILLAHWGEGCPQQIRQRRFNRPEIEERGL